MLSTLTMLLLSGLFFSLRLTGMPSSFPKPLSAAEEERQLRRMEQGDEAARTILIERNLRLVAHITKKYFVLTDDQEDLVSIGTIGLIKAVNTYRRDKGIRLATYASRCIENEVLMYLRRSKKRSGELSLSEQLDTDPDGTSLSLMDVLSTQEDMTEALVTQDSCRALRQSIAHALTPREQTVIRLRYGLGETLPHTQKQVADRLGISRSYVSRIEKKALEKLRKALSEESE